MSIESARRPKPGDDWWERDHIHICTVKSVCDAHVSLKWHTATKRDRVMTRKAFTKFMTMGYDTTWCDCIPKERKP